MKKTTLLLFLVSPFCLMQAFAQTADLPLFEEEQVGESCPSCKKKGPNIGTKAEPVDSVHFAPAPFPAVKVTMSSSDPLPERPFEGVNMQYEKRYSDPSHSYDSRLSAPVDFSKKKSVETASQVQIKNESENASKKEDKKVATGPKKQETVVKQEPVSPPVVAFQPTKKTTKTVDSSTFDIAGLQLTMSPEDIIETAVDSGFEISNVAYGIPSFMVTDFERSCRESGLYQIRLIHECVRTRAREEDVYYISQLVLKKPETKEQIIVLFSSGLTDNQAFKIDYTAFGDNSLGTSHKDLLKKTNRRDVFWKYVYDKYGRPNNGQTLIWGDLNGISLKAFLESNAMNGRIILQNAGKKGDDYRQAEAWSKEQDIENPFSF